MATAKCFSNGFVINWKVGGFLNKDGVGEKYSNEFELREKAGVKWRLLVSAKYDIQLDRFVVFVYLCNPNNKQNDATVRFMVSIYHEGGACSCEDKVC